MIELHIPVLNLKMDFAREMNDGKRWFDEFLWDHQARLHVWVSIGERELNGAKKSQGLFVSHFGARMFSLEIRVRNSSESYRRLAYM